MLILGLEKNKFLVFVSAAIIFIVLNHLFTYKLYDRFLSKHSDIISYIFIREYSGNKKYDIDKHFTSSEIENFIQNLDIDDYIEFNNLPTEFYYKRNQNCLILGFEKENLQHYTRSIPWEKIFWKYSHIKNDGIYEYLSIQYKRDIGTDIDEEIITDKILKKTFIFFCCLFYTILNMENDYHFLKIITNEKCLLKY